MSVEILALNSQQEIFKHMLAIGCDPAGAKIMAPKGIGLVVKIKNLDGWKANILKQEMLSLNGDVAVSRGSITGRIKKTDCLILGNLSQLNNLIAKLKRQSRGLKVIGWELESLVKNGKREFFSLKAGRFSLKLGKRTRVMGIVNLTPDSFSGDGLLREGNNPDPVRYVENLVRDGADIIDIGGESTRPGAKPVPAREEIKRVVPLIKSLSRKIRVPICIDTYKAEVARAALDAGAVMVNDIMGLRKNDPMLKVLKGFRDVPIAVMHIKGNPRTMQRNPVYADLMQEIISSLRSSIDSGLQAGIGEDRFIVDPGIGFGKTLEQNLRIINRLNELKGIGRPILIGTSRKSFIGRLLKKEADERIFGTAASVVCAVANGADIVRVHDVKPIKQAVKLADAITYN